ncbi:hypothetical protein BTVI_50616 [Pitangus sulphuratus]|nr:hypothetical protein BTVI_50616 [Pitangus sulphuratus]
MIRMFSLGIDDLVCIMTQAVIEATEPVAHEAYEITVAFWTPQEDMEPTDQVQRRASVIDKRTGDLLLRRQAENLGLFNLEK